MGEINKYLKEWQERKTKQKSKETGEGNSLGPESRNRSNKENTHIGNTGDGKSG